MVREISIEDVHEYLSCPLKYRFRNEFKLGALKRDLVTDLAKLSIQKWFNSLGKGMDIVKARKKVGDALEWKWKRDQLDPTSLPFIHSTVMQCLMTLNNHFDQQIDSPISGKLDIEMAIGGNLFTDVIDGLYFKNDKKPGAKKQDKHFVAVQIVSKDELTSSKVVEARRAMIRYNINSGMKPNPYKIKLLQLTMPNGQYTKLDLDKYAYDEFIYLARSISRGIDNDLYHPTSNSALCKECPYQKICSNKFCEPSVNSQIVGRARSSLNLK